MITKNEETKQKSSMMISSMMMMMAANIFVVVVVVQADLPVHCLHSETLGTWNVKMGTLSSEGQKEKCGHHRYVGRPSPFDAKNIDGMGNSSSSIRSIIYYFLLHHHIKNIRYPLPI